MRVVVAADHAGFALKAVLIPFVAGLGYEVVDLGPDTYDGIDDYPSTIRNAVVAVSNDPNTTRAIVIGGSGQGEAMVANRFPHVRAAVYYGAPLGSPHADLDPIILSRQHNDANVLALGARFLTDDDAQRAVERWLATPFSGEERHVRRIGEMEDETTDKGL